MQLNIFLNISSLFLYLLGKEYVVYSIDTDSENCDVLVSRLEKQPDGTDEIFDIEDEIEREKIHNIVNELLNA